MQPIGLRNIHFALLTDDDAEGVQYSAPEPLIGAVSAKISPASSSEILYADDGAFDVANALGDISFEMELATLPLKVQAVLLGHTYENGVMVQSDTDIPPYLAIGFMSRTTKGKYRFVWLLKGKFALMESEYATMESKPRWNNAKITGTFVKRIFDGQWQRTADTTDPDFTGADDWFKAVHGTETTQEGE